MPAQRETVRPGGHKLKGFAVARFRRRAAQTRRAAVAGVRHKPPAARPLQGNVLLSAANQRKGFLVARNEGFGAERAVLGGVEESSPGRPQHDLFGRCAGQRGKQRDQRQDRAERKEGLAAHGGILPAGRAAVQAQTERLVGPPPHPTPSPWIGGEPVGSSQSRTMLFLADRAHRPWVWPN